MQLNHGFGASASEVDDDNCNKCFLTSDNLIYISCSGDQNSKTVNETSQISLGLANQLKSRCQRILILANLRKIGKVSLSARQSGVEAIKNYDFDKAALCGDSYLLKHVINSIIIASGKKHQIRFFTNEKEAREWLNSF